MESLFSLAAKSVIKHNKLNDDNVYIILWRLHDIKLFESDLTNLFIDILTRYNKKEILKLLLEYLHSNLRGINGRVQNHLIKSVSLEIIYNKYAEILERTNTNKLSGSRAYLKSAFETIVLTKPIDLIEYFFSNVDSFAFERISVSFLSIGKILKMRSDNLKVNDANNVIDIFMKFSIIEPIDKIEKSEIITLIQLCGESKTNDLLKKYIIDYEKFVLNDMDIFLIDDMRSSIKNFSIKDSIYYITDLLYEYIHTERRDVIICRKKYLLNSIYAIFIYVDSVIINASEQEYVSFNTLMILMGEYLEIINYMIHNYDIENNSLSHKWIDYQNKILSAIKKECRYSGIFIDRFSYLV